MRKSPLLGFLIILLGLIIIFNILFFIQRSRRLSELSDISNQLVLYWSKVQFSTLNLLTSTDLEESALVWSEYLQLFKENFELLIDQREISRIRNRNQEISEISRSIGDLWRKAEGEYIELITSLYHVSESIPGDSPLRGLGMIFWPLNSSPEAAKYYSDMIARIQNSLILDRGFEMDILTMKDLIEEELDRLRWALLQLTLVTVSTLILLLIALLYTQFREISVSRDLALSLSSLLTENPDPVFRVSYDGRILQANKATRPLLEYWNAGPARQLPEKLMKLMEEKLNEGGRATLEQRIGDRFFHLTVIDRPGDRYRNVYGSDISARRDLENQLRQSQKMEAVGQLAGGIAHDFNNLLSGIMASAQLIEREENIPREVLGYTDIIVQSCDQGAGLTSKLLSFSRKEQNVLDRMDLYRILESTLAIIRRTIDKRVNISFERFTDRTAILGDSSSLQSVFLNLAINASHAMPAGGEIRIAFREKRLDESYCSKSIFELKPGDFCLVEFEDSGSGIPPENLNKIFDPFFTTKEKGKGTGLGLSTVFGVIRQHEGAIQVNSEVGKGTQFKLYFPMAGSGVDSPATRAAEPPSGQA